MLDMMLIMINYRTRPAEEVFTRPPKRILTSDPYVWLGQQSKTADWMQTPQTPEGDLPTYDTLSILQIDGLDQEED